MYCNSSSLVELQVANGATFSLSKHIHNLNHSHSLQISLLGNANPQRLINRHCEGCFIIPFTPRMREIAHLVLSEGFPQPGAKHSHVPMYCSPSR